MKSGIPYRNHSPYGWWIASYVLRAAWNDEIEPAPGSTCQSWENTIILQAPDREAAYGKALRLASQACTPFEDSDPPHRTGQWVLEGLSSLLPIYEELVDGAEILWREHRGESVATVRSWARKKEDLEVFDDTPSVGDMA